MAKRFLTPVELPGNAGSLLHAVPKQQMDAAIAAAVAGITGPSRDLSARPASTGVLSAMRTGMDTCMQLIGDSTGDTQDEWFGVLGEKIGADFPSYNVVFMQWVGSTFQRYGGATYLQSGPSGHRYVSLASGAYLQLAGPSVAGAGVDLEVRIKFRPMPDWTPAAACTIVSKYNSVGNLRGWALNMNPSGTLTLNWSADGTALNTATSGVSMTTVATDGQPMWLRMTVDVDNGASGRTVKYYTAPGTLDYPSIALSDWTQLGGDVTAAGVTSIFDNTTVPYTLGAQANGANLFIGDIYWCDIRKGLDGHHVVAPLPNAYDLPTTVSSDLISFGGSPTLLLLNGSEGGQNIAYWNDSVRRPKLAFQAGQQLILLSTGHNEGQLTGTGVFPQYKTFLDNVKTLVPYVPIVGVSQNPTILGTSQTAGGLLRHKRRMTRLLSFYNSQDGMWGLDTWPAFDDLNNQIDPDGIHTLPAGNEVWGEYIYQALFAA